MRAAFGWVHRAAAVLRNKKGLDAAGVRRRDGGLVAAVARHAERAGRLRAAIGQFREVTRSYWPGRFRCYDVADLPRTNNELEQYVGSDRDPERRGRGRTVACPGAVVRGSVRLAAAAATRSRPLEVTDLVPPDLSAWGGLRDRLERRQEVRALGRRFRRDPVAYLRSLEEALIKAALPP